jgi:hypothetical protein
VSSVIQHEAFRNYYLCGQFQPTMVALQPNAAASKWVDLMSLIQSQDVDVTDAAGDVVSDGFLSAVEKYSTDDEPLAAAWRWQIVVADDHSNLELQLQSLPARADHLLAQPIFRLKCYSEHSMKSEFYG